MFEEIFGTALRQVAPILIFMVLAFGALVVLKARLGGSPTQQMTFPYVRRPGLFTEAEARFLPVLREASPRLSVFGKVRLEDVIAVRPGMSQSDRQTARNRIMSRHLDFVLVDPTSTHVVCALELDDASHRSERARRTDSFKDKALAAAGVPLVRVSVRASYEVEEVRQWIDAVLGLQASTAKAT